MTTTDRWKRMLMTRSYGVSRLAIIGIVWVVVMCTLWTVFRDRREVFIRKDDHPKTDAMFEQSNTRDYSKEAYVTLLAPGDPHPWSEGKVDYYFENCKMMAQRLLRNATTRDPFNRPFVILATPSVPEKQIDVLSSHGALVRRVPLIDPPSGTIDMERINQRYKDQFTKLHVWNLTEYKRVAYFDADTLIIRPIHSIFDTPTSLSGDDEWLFAAVYDSGNSREDNHRNAPGPDDKGRGQDNQFSAGVFLLYPTLEQFNYIFGILENPPERDWTTFMEQDMLRWAYRDGGPYPWIRLSHLYNTQWSKSWDMDSAFVLHDKLWLPGRDEKLQSAWYQAWGEMVGWDASRNVDGIERWRDTSDICVQRK
jgi:alpha-N-acetylglucosamine transferase